jgi:hypothetical protein
MSDDDEKTDEVEPPEESDEGADEEPQPWAKLGSGDKENLGNE